ncbi:MAG TPA: septum formation initiator family protein [Candidatus Acidoferrales bacterium]|nr:septum formation initiator family protein [Candidatus Acidoferrales bacterium]
MTPPPLPQRWLVTGLGALIFALALFTFFGDRGIVHIWRLADEKRKLDEASFLLQQENEALRHKIHRLRHDDLYLEKVAREELGLVRPGEIVYRFAPAAAGRGAPGASGAPAPRRSWEQKPRP